MFETYGRNVFRTARREEIDARDADLVEQAAKLILDDVWQRTDDEQRSRRAGGRARGFGRSAARHASSPCVNVVSMPLPE